MSKIADLVKRMELIPDKEKRATKLGDMITIRDKLRESADDAERLRALSLALEAIDGVEFIDKARHGLAQATTTAANLKKRYANGSEFDRKRADDALTSIKERLENALTTVTKGWRTLIDDQAKRFKPLAEAAERAQLPGANSLRDAIVLLEGWRDSPPFTSQAAEAYVANAARLPASIASLGLQGRAGRFMVDASNGRAKARDLQDLEVLAFLDSYPAVWSMLKVGL
jgi:hypothetical protein